MASKTDKRINKFLKRYKRENGRGSAIFSYHFLDEQFPDFIPSHCTCTKASSRAFEHGVSIASHLASVVYDSPDEFLKRAPKSHQAR